MQGNRRGAARRAVRTALALTVATALIVTGSALAQAATTNPNPGSLELRNAALSKRAATEGMVLLENNDHALPMPKTGNVAVYGVGAYKTVKGGTGSGDVNNRYLVTVRQGLENAGYAVTTGDAYWQAMTAAYDAKYGTPTGGIFGPAIDYSSVEQTLTPSTVQPKAATDTAIYVLARNSGEGTDRKPGAGDYELTDVERADIQIIGQTYRKVVVLLNVGGIVDTSFFEEINAAANDPSGERPLDAMLLMSQGGQESGNAVTEVLNGTVTPSGKLTDTWASQYSYYPAAATFGANDGDPLLEQYTEGVYVGYRYFDSKYRALNAANPESVVEYPFGYGMSYTDLQIAPQSVTASMDEVTVKARVTNVGDDYSGRDVVQVYVSAPQSGLDKPYQQLAGYAKTDSLAPGSSQVVTVAFDTTDLASYNEATAAYGLEAGDYLVRVGDSSRNTRVAAKLALAQNTVTEQLANELNDRRPTSELTSSPDEFYSYPTEAEEIAAAPAVALDTAGFTPANNASEYQQSVAVDTTLPYYALDRGLISTTTAYVDPDQTDWEGTGGPYAAKTGEQISPVQTDSAYTLYDVQAGRITLQQFVAGLTVTQLANIVEGASAAGTTLTAVGAAGYTTAKYETLGLPAMTLADGPAGLRITQKIPTTPATYQFTTAWPIGTMLAQTWDRPLLKEVATAIGQEMAEYGVSLWLAPGMNIHRDPLNGRNFEYYSEDPLVTGLTAGAMTEGVQSVPGEGVTIKHYAANNQEASRNTSDSVIGERAAREIYLKGFEIAVKSAQPMAVMTSYNRINDTYASGSYDLNTDILRGEWGFEGLVMTDWGAGPRTGATGVMYSGNDLIEPGNNPGEIINAIKKVAPTIDVSGLPVYNKLTTLSNNRTSYQWSFGGVTPSPTGTQVITTRVDQTTDLTRTPLSGSTVRDTINNEVFTPNAPYASVQTAYADVTALLASTSLSAVQKSGITVTDVAYQTPGDATTPVVAYTVTVRGDYPAAGFNLRLGDLQRSAARVIDVAMQTAGFQALASLNGVSGITVGSYTGQFNDLRTFVRSSLGRVIGDQTGDGPSLALSVSPAPNDDGWNTSDVTVTATSGDDDAQIYIAVDSDELRPYVGAVEITGDGTHEVRALAVGDDGEFSTLEKLEVKIDTEGPVVTATGTDGVLTLTATDALSGVGATEYSLDGRSWIGYTAPVTVNGAPKTVAFRAADVAGNMSEIGTVAVSAPPVTTAPPTITKQPDPSVSVIGRTRVTLTAAADGAPAPSVKWQVSTNSGRTWKTVARATEPSYTFTVKTGDSGNRYRAVFTNSAGSATTSATTLTVKTETAAKLKIADRTVSTSQRAKVTVTVAPRGDRPTGTVTLHYGAQSTTAKLVAGDRGRVTLSLPKLKKGEYTVYATYEGSDAFAGDTSNKITLRVR
jgi:beta-glucosidase-like glycosyl hydrolase